MFEDLKHEWDKSKRKSKAHRARDLYLHKQTALGKKKIITPSHGMKSDKTLRKGQHASLRGGSSLRGIKFTL